MISLSYAHCWLFIKRDKFSKRKKNISIEIFYMEFVGKPNITEMMMVECIVDVNVRGSNEFTDNVHCPIDKRTISNEMSP